MASLNYSALVPIFFQITLFLMIFHTPTILSQDPSSTSPNIAKCTSSLLPLIPCTPFVQGTSRSPGQPCCGNLEQLYSQEPHCLCLLLNNTVMSSFPVNRTRALQLPVLCDLQVDVSTCPGEQLQVAPTSQISFRAKNSTVAASPAFSLAPRPSMRGFGFGSNQAISLKVESGLAVLMTSAVLLLTLLIY